MLLAKSSHKEPFIIQLGNTATVDPTSSSNTQNDAEVNDMLLVAMCENP